MSAAVVVDGLVLGGIAAFDAIGLVLLYRTARVVNLAQSSMGLVGGVLTGMLVQAGGWSFWWAAPLGVAVGALIGWSTDRIVLRRLQNAPRAVVLIATVGIAHVLSGLSVAIPRIFGGPLPTYNLDFGPRQLRDRLDMTGPELLVLLALPVAWLATRVFLERTRFGIAALALGQEAERARTLGVPAATVRGVAWAAAGVLASFAGILSIPVWGFNLGGGFSATVLLFALAPAVLAALRHIDVAVLAALALGVLYRVSQGWFDRASDADVVLGLAIVLAVAMQRRELGRVAAAARAASWRAATTPRPLSMSARTDPLVRSVTGTLVVVAAMAAMTLPRFLPPSEQIAYTQLVAYAIAALGVAVAWMYAGEISLGHWGFAVHGAVIAATLPGPWLLRCILAAGALALAGVPIALATRRATFAFAAVSLSAAAIAPVVAVRSAGRIVDADIGLVATVAGLLAVGIVAGLVRVRATPLGAAMVAARDEPQRAPSLGVNVLQCRVIALCASLALAGLAGALYVSGSGVGIPQASADPRVSFDLLAMTVIGGIGSAVGAVLGAVAVFGGAQILPPVWASLLSGAGILVVVVAAPAGLSRVSVTIRDAVVRRLTRAPRAAEASS